MTAGAAKPLFRFADLSFDDLGRTPDAIQDLWQRSLDGLIIRGVLSQRTREAALDRLARGAPPLRSRVVEHEDNGTEPPRVFSGGLITSAPDLVSYFEDAAHFRAGCRELFQGHEDFESRFVEAIGRTNGGLPLAVPTGPEGQSYCPATIRVLPSGREIALHSGNDFLHRPECAHMRGLIDNRTQLSYFIPLLLPATGGQLELYDVSWDDTDGERRINGAPVALMVALSKKMTVPVGEGDLLVFDGGRIYHRVLPVGAGGRRVTIGGFLGYAKDHQTIYYWS